MTAATALAPELPSSATPTVPTISRFPAPSDFPDSPVSQALRQPMMLGLFLPIQAGGWSASHLERTTSWTFDYNAALVQRAEHFGFDLAFGLSQWLPKGGYGGVLTAKRSTRSPRWQH